jgi:hypothetical protein
MTTQSESEVARQAPRPQGAAAPATVAEPARRGHIARVIFVVLASLFAACVVAQVFIAGMAVFVNPLNWRWHTTFIHVFEFLPLLMLIISFVGRLPAAQRWQCAALFLLIVVQYFTANVAASLPFAAALHPVNALLIFWMATWLLSRAWRYTFRTRGASPTP